MLIGLINGCTNIYSYNNNVCLGVCWISFLKIAFSMKRGYGDVFLFVGMVSVGDYKFNYFLVGKGVIGAFWGMGKNM